MISHHALLPKNASLVATKTPNKHGGPKLLRRRSTVSEMGILLVSCAVGGSGGEQDGVWGVLVGAGWGVLVSSRGGGGLEACEGAGEGVAARSSGDSRIVTCLV